MIRKLKLHYFFHNDLNGPLKSSKDDYKYVIKFVDEDTDNIAIYFLKLKSDDVAEIKHFLADVSPWGTLYPLLHTKTIEHHSPELFGC